MKRFTVRCNWHARFHGGLFLGFRYEFPVRVIYDDQPDFTWERDEEFTYATRRLLLGFLLFTITFTLKLPVRQANQPTQPVQHHD